MEGKVFGRGSYRDGGGRSVEGGHKSQRIKGTERKLRVMRRNTMPLMTTPQNQTHRGVRGEKVVSWPPSSPTNPC